MLRNSKLPFAGLRMNKRRVQKHPPHITSYHNKIVPRSLRHLVHCKGHAGNFSGRSILVVYAFLGSLVDRGSCGKQRALCGSLILRLDGSVHFLDRCLNAGLDGFVSLSLRPVYQNSLFADLILAITSSISKHLRFFFLLLIGTCLIKAGHGRLNRNTRILF